MLGRLFDKLSFYVLLFLLVLLTFSMFQNYQRVKRVDKQIKDKEEEVQKMKDEGVELSEKLQMVESSQFIESQLRDKLGLSKEGEVVVVLPSDEVLRSIAPKYVEEEEDLPDPNWKKWIRLFITNG